MDRVLEIGGFAAAYCGRLFAHQKADVVHVDQQPEPAWASDSAMTGFLHAGKRRLASADPEMLAELARKADVVILEAENADAVAASGFDSWQAPVKLAITPFGRTGPKRNWRATANVLLAMGGYTHLVGDPDRAPLTLPGHYVEFQTGAIAYAAVNACRLAAEESVIDLSMLETVMSLSQFTTVRWHCAGEIRERHGSDFYWVVPSDLFACRDGWVYINIVPAFWDAFTVFVDLPELLLDARFASNDLRREHRFALRAMAAPVIAQYTRAELMARAEETRIPLGIVQTFEEVLDDPHLAAREFWETTTFDDRHFPAAGVPWRIDSESRPSLVVSESEPT